MERRQPFISILRHFTYVRVLGGNFSLRFNDAAAAAATTTVESGETWQLHSRGNRPVNHAARAMNAWAKNVLSPVHELTHSASSKMDRQTDRQQIHIPYVRLHTKEPR